MTRLILFLIPVMVAAETKDLNVRTGPVTYKGKVAMRITEVEGKTHPGEDRLAIRPEMDFGDGTIELDIAGAPAAGAGEGARGFVGIAFRIAPDASKFECFYLRPTNGRADDQLRRNHSTQYFSFPAFPWNRLRTENPGVYESYADMQPGEWTKVRIEVKGSKARLYVNGSAQPALIVNDLKHGTSRGAIGYWIGPGTEAHFGEMKVTAEPAPTRR